ncbi:multiple epidermal growth factor-like domains protein 11 [Gigantopelta aegis]|uniref:multiple epidermal growth factor-like domains protein 11 n=1 Tax=Gigantopelta aegis TaxID=1735272 RepID=UPI001B88E3BB|nr:multiple epidermal growth factor-like domains protein 11 [Gigantopelta aegis]
MDFCEVEVYVCDAGTFGDDCSQFCHCRDGPCNYTNGYCIGGCKPNWTGTNCNDCDSSHYGDLCSKQCSSRHCDETTGVSSCDVRGSCDRGCDPGWKGTDCLEQCPDGQYGKACGKSCADRKCLDSSSSCDHVTGKCVSGCQRGYQYVDCTELCSVGTYGYNCSESCDDRHCSGNQNCDRYFGNCTRGCLSGWKLTDCTVGCTGTYGPGCSSSCSARHCKADDAPCDHVTGSCDGPCDAGWQGDTCTDECDTGKYGDNCAMFCAIRNCVNKDVCPRKDGKCVSGCISGFEGLDCLRAQAVTSNSDSTTIAVSVVAGVLFVLLIIVTSVLFWHLKGHKVKSDSYQQEMRKINTNPPSQTTDPSAVEYEIFDGQDGGHNSPRAFSSQQVDTSSLANYGNSWMSRDEMDAQPRHSESGGGYVNAGQTNEYEKLELFNPPQNDYDRITGV